MGGQTNLKKRLEKKSESIEVRLPYSIKTNFMEKCTEDGDTASHVLRGFIASYLRTKPNNRIAKFAPIALVLPILITGLYISHLTETPNPQTSLAQQALFSSFDTNHDGFLTATDARDETRPALFAMLEHADGNQDGRLSEGEIYALPTVTLATNMLATDNKDSAGQTRYLTLALSVGKEQDIDDALKKLQTEANLSESALMDLEHYLKTTHIKWVSP